MRVHMRLELYIEMYSKHVVFKNGKKLIYVVLLRKIYEIIVAAILVYKNFCGEIGFELNTYDICVSNRIKVGKQHTVRFHVDNVNSSHMIPKVNYKLKEWKKHNYGNHSEVN